ncbi:hypothetical protein [Wenyingzhuangia sp. IMCC45574]
MKRNAIEPRIPFLVLVVSIVFTVLLSNKGSAVNAPSILFSAEQSFQKSVENPYQKQALSILQNKCNTCHKKRNPFLIFKEKNMNRRAKRIKKQVFELKRMPKEGGVPLTKEEYGILKSWIESL